MRRSLFSFFFFFNDTATTEIYTLSLHDALPISQDELVRYLEAQSSSAETSNEEDSLEDDRLRLIFTCCHPRSEEHTSELQSRLHLVCRLLLEKKKIQ